ncbi:hypothetical protein LXL04_013365 [Taraxacum kok-saghyz]
MSHVQPLEIKSTHFHGIDDADDTSHHTSESYFSEQSSSASPNFDRPNNMSKTSKPSTHSAPSASTDPLSSFLPKSFIKVEDLALNMQKVLQHFSIGPTIP